jgi:hypothetical protein
LEEGGLVQPLSGRLQLGGGGGSRGEAIELLLERGFLDGQGVSGFRLLGQLAVGVGQRLTRLVQGLRVGGGGSFGLLLLEGDLQQVVLFHQPFDLLLSLGQLARVDGGGLDRERLFELGLQDGFLRLQLAHLVLQSAELFVPISRRRGGFGGSGRRGSGRGETGRDRGHLVGNVVQAEGDHFGIPIRVTLLEPQ